MVSGVELRKGRWASASKSIIKVESGAVFHSIDGNVEARDKHLSRAGFWMDALLKRTEAKNPFKNKLPHLRGNPMPYTREGMK
jgi:hypothetical protein